MLGERAHRAILISFVEVLLFDICFILTRLTHTFSSALSAHLPLSPPLQALEHPYLAQLHCEDDEPTFDRIALPEFEFERRVVSQENIRDLIFHEVATHYEDESDAAIGGGKLASPPSNASRSHGSSHGSSYTKGKWGAEDGDEPLPGLTDQVATIAGILANAKLCDPNEDRRYRRKSFP